MQRITLLYDASQAILSTFEADEVLQRILTIAQDYFHLRTVAILLLDDEGQELYVRSHIGWNEQAQNSRISLSKGLIGLAARIKRPVYSGNVLEDDRYLEMIPETRSEVAIPLMVRDSVVGVLDCQSDNLDHFDSDTIDLLTLFSTQASMALQNARLYTLERKRATQLQAINSIARHATSVLDLDHLVKSVCTLVQRCFSADHACVLLREDGRLVLRAQFGFLAAQIADGEVFPCATDFWSGSTESGIEILGDLSQNLGSQRLCEDEQSRITIPLISYRQPLGLLVLSSRERNAFAQVETQPLESVADVFASAIQNANYIQRVKQLAYLDGLTGIFNRRYFETRITEEIERARRYGNNMAAMIIDVDRFKSLNDDFGHLLGDEVLRQVSSLLAQQIRKTDVVCRYGGEEFVILLPQTTAEQALLVAEKLRRAVETWQFPGVSRPVTISGGVSIFPDQGNTRDQLVQAADKALYVAKESGRNKMQLAGEALAARAGD